MKKTLATPAIPAAASVYIVGQPADTGTGNCYPFGCAYNAEYQQAYTHSLFTTGPRRITGLEFYSTQFDSGATTMNTASWTIALSTTSADWNTISGNFSSNLGSNNTVVFSGNLFQSRAFGDTLNITFTKAFTYDPSNSWTWLPRTLPIRMVQSSPTATITATSMVIPSSEGTIVPVVPLVRLEP